MIIMDLVQISLQLFFVGLWWFGQVPWWVPLVVAWWMLPQYYVRIKLPWIYKRWERDAQTYLAMMEKAHEDRVLKEMARDGDKVNKWN